MNINNIYVKEKTAIIISVESVFNNVKKLFIDEIPKSWFDNNEVDEIIIRIFNIMISSILNNTDYKNSKNYNECYQGNIDYLEYCGLSQNTSFKIIHLCEMQLLKTIFDTYPILDNKSMITIIDYKLINKKDLLIVIVFNKHEKNHETNNNYPNYKNSGIV